MKKILLIGLAVIALGIMSFDTLNWLHLMPNADVTNVFSVYDVDRNEIFNINTVDDQVEIGSGVAVTGGAFSTTTLTSPTITGPSISSGFVTGNASFRGTGAFTLTEAVDTVVITGLLATDFVVVGGEYVGGVDQQDVLQAEIKADTLIVHRLANGESAAAYNYVVVR